MTEHHMIEMSEKLGELNGTVKSLSETMEKFAESSNAMHKDHYGCCQDNKVDIGKINARHSTYWKVITSFGGIGALGAFLAKMGHHIPKIGGG